MDIDTKELIANTLSEMLLENGFDKITVINLTEKCHISRRTFYHHFKDLFDVIVWTQQKRLEEATDKLIKTNDPVSAIIALTDNMPYMLSNIRRFLDTKHRIKMEENLLDSIRYFLEKFLSLSEVYNSDKAMMDFAVEFFACGITKYLIERSFDEKLDGKHLSMLLINLMEGTAEKHSDTRR